jgi:hypothetical protein
MNDGFLVSGAALPGLEIVLKRLIVEQNGERRHDRHANQSLDQKGGQAPSQAMQKKIEHETRVSSGKRTRTGAGATVGARAGSVLDAEAGAGGLPIANYARLTRKIQIFFSRFSSF